MLPILYSFRRCPYAMRARLALRYSGTQVELREILLANKPAQMLEVSPKGTVPVLLLPDGQVIDESYDIMRWALQRNDPDKWLADGDFLQRVTVLLKRNDDDFKQHLDHYKYADRFPQHSAAYYRQQGELFLQYLESLLAETAFLFADRITLADMIVLPFIRQFAQVDKDWFTQTAYRHLQGWLDKLVNSELFSQVMHKYPVWLPGSKRVIF